MRSLFQKKEDSPVYVAPTQTVPTNTVAATPTEIRVVAVQKSPTRAVKVARTPLENRVRARRMALATLAVSLAFGGRWYAANVEPTYPTGQGVYPAQNAAPKWGAMKEPNAATFYMAATDALDLPAIKKSLEGVEGGIRYLSDKPIAVQKNAVNLAQLSLTLLRQGMTYPYIADYQTNYFRSNPVTATGLERPSPSFIPIRETARLLAAEARVRASENNHAGAIESSLDAVRLGTDVGQGHTLIDGMIGVLLQSIGAREGVRHVAHLSASEARIATARLETILANEPSFAHIITADRDTAYEILQSVHNVCTLSGVKSWYTGEPNPRLSGVKGVIAYNALLVYSTKQGLANDVAVAYDSILTRVKLPYQQTKNLGEITPSANPLVRELAPSHPRAFRQTTLIAAWNRVLLTKLAAQAYRAEHAGAFPASLSVLTQGAKPYLKAVPTDPFSMTGTEPLRYDNVTGDIYSVGENGLDDGNVSGSDDNSDLFAK